MATLHKFVTIVVLAVLAIGTSASDFCHYSDACTKAWLTGVKNGMLIDECKKVYKIDGACKLTYVGKIQ